MSLSNVPLSTEQLNGFPFVGAREGASLAPATEISAPGKVFLLGEYAVLAGSPALLSAVGPRFRVHAQPQRQAAWPMWEERRAPRATGDVHPQGPLGRLLDWSEKLGAHGIDLEFADPHHGFGGFGASTAEFALGYRAIAAQENWEASWERVWRLYRELTSSTSAFYPPSGADLVAQWVGGTIVFRPDSLESGPAVWESLNASPRAAFPGESLIVFSAAHLPGRKTATHAHLAEMREEGGLDQLNLELRPTLEQGLTAAVSGDVEELGRAFSDYADILRNHGLELAEAGEDRQALAALPGVAGVKGSGAMLSDSMLVVMASADAAARAQVIAAAEARGLRLLTDGIRVEPGVTIHR